MEVMLANNVQWPLIWFFILSQTLFSRLTTCLAPFVCQRQILGPSTSERVELCFVWWSERNNFSIMTAVASYPELRSMRLRDIDLGFQWSIFRCEVSCCLIVFGTDSRRRICRKVRRKCPSCLCHYHAVWHFLFLQCLRRDNDGKGKP